jgi:hypothetical protein
VTTFQNVFITDGTIVMQNASGPITVPLLFRDSPLPITIHAAIVTMTRTDSSHVQGTLGGVLDTQEILDVARPFASNLDGNFCGSAFDEVTQQIEQAQDILTDGTNSRSAYCDAISIGIGFNASLVGNPTTVGVNPPTLTDLCDASDAGGD